jgi:hypothetical protein
MSSFAQNAGLVERVIFRTSAPAEAATAIPPLGVKPRGRRPGVRTVPDTVTARRAKWLRNFTKTPGMNMKLCCLLEASDSFVSHLLAGRRTFTNRIAEKIEQVLGLESGTIDSEASASTDGVFQPVVPEIEKGKKCRLDPGLETVLVNVLKHALSEGLVSDKMAIKILMDITT